MKLSLVDGRFYLSIARLLMPPLEQALRRRCDFVGGGLPKRKNRNPDREAYATRSFRRFFRTVEFCFWSVSGGMLAGRLLALAGEGSCGRHWRCCPLAVAPTFALIALLTCVFKGDVLCMNGQGAWPLSGMVPMYLLMSAFHLAPWRRLRRQGAAWHPCNQPESIRVVLQTDFSFQVHSTIRHTLCAGPRRGSEKSGARLCQD
ncbi:MULTISPECIES: hypothetical protein [unclassified Mesorhizobium]|uniref:hypothetical protein n=1 Tax=unclassified Mesorhizobium TaxID=325217 RepID=UPI0033381F45